MGIYRRIGALGKRSRLDSEIEEELRAHMAMRADDNVAAGMNPQAASRDARIRFGNPTVMKEKVAAVDTALFLSSMWSDMKYALRQLRKNPGFAITAILMLSLGMGASVAIFAFVDAALLKPLPYREPARLTSVTETVKLFGRAVLSYPDYLDWKRRNTVFQSLDVYSSAGVLLNTPAGTMPVPGLRVTDGFFRTLGIVPILGRDFYAGEDLAGTGNTVILSYSGWQKWLSGRPDAIGQRVLLSGDPYTVIGVLPQSFSFALRGTADFWLPFHAKSECDLRRSCHGLMGIGRLKDGVTIEAARGQMISIAADLERLYPGDNRGQSAAVDSLAEIVVGDVRPILLVLLAGAGLLLLIACVNVSSLLLVRSESRRREIAVRGALGATRGRLVRQFLIESMLLVLLGSTLGLTLAMGAMRALTSLLPKDMMLHMPYLENLSLGSHALLFAAGISMIALLLFALTPVLRLPLMATRNDLSEGARGSAGTLWRRFGMNLVVLELAIAVVLLVGAGLLGKSFYRLLHVDLNFNPDHLAMLEVMAPSKLYPQGEDDIRLQRQLFVRIASLPGVQSVGFTTVPPVSFNGNTDWIRFVGRPFNGEHNEVNDRDVTADYLKTLQAKLLRGRFFTDEEDATKPKVVIINKKLADMYYPGQDPIGQRFGNGALDPNSIKQIIGVVDNIKEGSLDSEIWPAVYYPLYQNEDDYFTLVVRTSQSEASILPALVATIRNIDPSIGTSDVSTMDEHMHDSPTAYLHRSAAWLVGAFAVLALVLGVVGLYGVIAYSVSQRTREIGVRMALGAQRSSVYQLVMSEAGRLTLLGICVGLVCSIGAATLMRKLLFGTEAWDVPTLLAVAGVLGASAMLASYLPAHRAASVNPVEALRSE